MIGARQLFKESINFLLKNPRLLFYHLLCFIPVLFVLGGMAIIILSVGTLSLATFSFYGILGAISGILFGSLFIFILPFIVALPFTIISLGFSVYIQAILRDSPISMIQSLNRSWMICKKSWWVIPVYIIYFFSGMTLLGLFAVVALFYFHQLLIDGETSFVYILKESWYFFRKTFWTLARFLLINILFPGILVLLSLLFFLLSVVAYYVPLLSSIFISIGIMLSIIALFFSLFNFIIVRIGVNKLYLSVKSSN